MNDVDLNISILDGVLEVMVNGVAMLKLVGVRRITVNDRIIYEPAGHVVEE